MSTEQEQIIERIDAFTAGAEMSRAAIGKVLSISPRTLTRWEEGHPAQEWVARAVKRKLDLLEKAQEEHNVYFKLHGLSPKEKVDLLTGVLYNKLTWQ